MTFLLRCDYCDNESQDIEDYKILPSGKKECWRCQFYYIDTTGKYAIKNRWFVDKKTKLTKFVDDGTGHYILR